VNIRERDLGMDRRITLQWILEDIGWYGVQRNDMAKHKDKWLVILNIVMNIRLHKMQGISLQTEGGLAFQWLCAL
jgi:hypothetical protein